MMTHKELSIEQDKMRLRWKNKSDECEAPIITEEYITTRFGPIRRAYKVNDEVARYFYAFQKGRCAICRNSITLEKGTMKDRRFRAHMDHNHATGIDRGLLCSHCNLLIGFAQDNPEILKKAIEYLEMQSKVIIPKILYGAVNNATNMRGTCSIDRCSKNRRSQGMCPMHYARWKKTGDATRTPKGKTPERGLIRDRTD